MTHRNLKEGTKEYDDRILHVQSLMKKYSNPKEYDISVDNIAHGMATETLRKERRIEYAE